jgi:hypothetical protein
MGAIASDVTGTWSGAFKVNGGDHGVPQLMMLKQDGVKLSGFAGPDAREQSPLENGKIEGDHLTFEVTRGKWKFTYDLKRTGPDEVKGDLGLKSLNNGRSAVISLRRVK